MLKTLKNIRRRDTDKYMIPHSVQEVIPIRTVWKSGILLVGQNRYSRTWQFSDINYALAGEEDQKSMLLGYSALLNLCDSNADTKLSIVTRKLNRRDFEEYIMIPYENDGRDHYRKEYNDTQAQTQAESSHNMWPVAIIEFYSRHIHAEWAIIKNVYTVFIIKA